MGTGKNDKLQEIRESLSAAIKSNPFLYMFLNSTNNFDRIVEYVPRAIMILYQNDEGKEILKGLGILDYLK